MDEHLLKRSREIISSLLKDKVANIRYLAIQALARNIQLRDNQTQASIIKLKQDPDLEVREAATSLLIWLKYKSYFKIKLSWYKNHILK